MSRKDDALRELDDSELLELARSVSKSPVRDGTSTSVLKKIIKESLSIEEIKEKVKSGAKRVEPGAPVRAEARELTHNELRPGAIGQVFLVISALLIPLANYYTYLGAAGDFYNVIFVLVVINVSSFFFLLFTVLFWVSAKRVVSLFGGGRSWIFVMVFGVAAFLVFLSLDMSLLLNLTASNQALSVIYSIFSALPLILVGVFFVKYHKGFLNAEVWLLAGMFYVFAGVSEFPLGYPFVNPLYSSSILPGILGALCFFASTARGHPEPVKFTRDDLRVGAFGMGALAVSVATFILGYFTYLLSQGPIIPDYYLIMAPWGLVGSGFLLLSSMLIGVSMLKVRSKLGGNNLGLAGALLGAFAAACGVLYYGLTVTGATLVIPALGTSSLNALGFALSTGYFWLVGVAITLLGSFLLVHRESGLNGELWMVSAIAYIIIGSGELGLAIYQYVPLVLFVAGVMGVACFLGKRETR